MERTAKRTAPIVDTEGWIKGVEAALKQVFRTDVELRIEHGGVKEEVKHAKDEVGRMGQEAEALLSALNGADKRQSEVEQELEAIIKDL